MLHEQRLAVQCVDGDVISAIGIEKLEYQELFCESAARELTDHLTSVIDSFLGHISSSVSGVMFHCERIFARSERCTELLTLVCPEMSVDGWNLSLR